MVLKQKYITLLNAPATLFELQELKNASKMALFALYNKDRFKWIKAIKIPSYIILNSMCSSKNEDIKS